MLEGVVLGFDRVFKVMLGFLRDFLASLVSIASSAESRRIDFVIDMPPSSCIFHATGSAPGGSEEFLSWSVVTPW
jgi:hypothetical protein